MCLAAIGTDPAETVIRCLKEEDYMNGRVEQASVAEIDLGILKEEQ